MLDDEEDLMEKGKQIWLTANEEKTKSTIVMRHNNRGTRYIVVDN